LRPAGASRTVLMPSLTRPCRWSISRAAASSSIRRKIYSNDERTLIMWRASVLTIFPEMFPGRWAQPRRQGNGGGLWGLDTIDIRATRRPAPLGGRHAGRRWPRHGDAADVLARALDAAAPATDERPRC